MKTFERMVAGHRNFVDADEEFTRSVDLSDLAFDPAELLEGVGDKKPGRYFRM